MYPNPQGSSPPQIQGAGSPQEQWYPNPIQGASPLQHQALPPQIHGSSQVPPQDDSKKRTLISTTITVVLVVMAVVVILGVLSGNAESPDEEDQLYVHRQVAFTVSDFPNVYMFAVDYDARVLYTHQNDEYVGNHESITKLTDSRRYEKFTAYTVDMCFGTDATPDQLYYASHIIDVLPPKDAKIDGSKTVSGISCDVYLSADHDQRWCVADGFVVEVEDNVGTSLVTNHEKLTQDSWYFDEYKLCPDL
ncbi:hypothetical protein GEMRC1_004588 [Eukaryota sp. GEM-RC1]